ncbi:GNAT family N-acetyltransferase [Pseudomonas syringae group sp. 26L6]|uniref:GNAT family N-acetyltransferase n=1 Tax=Pseudomonas syringae group sp. 26L6 TaxID=3079591 RepID=UPI0029095C80|nr:GNAT family N-acetyltransferase [Pseudomonas syringae group sp. 26L6]MDU8644865.1 GNAT family N-acetyltransferase [Pseudomonas syringae group sp. 26L6]
MEKASPPYPRSNFYGQTDMTTHTPNGLSIRPMQPSDLDKVIQWTSGEGWNLGLNDGRAFQVADPTGLFVACLNDDPVAAISAVKYGDTIGFVGLYIVREDLRGKGMGYPLWKAAMTSLEGRTVGLDAVVAQQGNYARSGFEMAFKTTRYAGIPQVLKSNNPCVQSIGEELIDRVLDYDWSFFPASRETFLRHWLLKHSSYSVAYVEEGVVKGFGAIRPAESGYKICPLSAQNEFIAESIFCSLVAWADGASVILDVPQPNKVGTLLAESYELTPLFETARMYRGTAPDLPLAKIFGMLTLEIG